MLMIYSESGALILGLTRGTPTRLQTANPITLDCPRPVMVEHILVLFGEDKVELLDKLVNAGFGHSAGDSRRRGARSAVKLPVRPVVRLDDSPLFCGWTRGRIGDTLRASTDTGFPSESWSTMSSPRQRS